jgi:addiction module HigA family antidote
MAKKLSPITPGDVLMEEFLKPMGISQNQLAKDINVPANRISQLVHNKREISTDTALRLGRYFGIEPEFWLNLQVRYNMKVVKSKVGKKIEKEVKIHFSDIDDQNFTPASA